MEGVGVVAWYVIMFAWTCGVLFVLAVMVVDGIEWYWERKERRGDRERV